MIDLIAQTDESMLKKRPPELLVYALTIFGMLANPLITPNLTDIVADFNLSNSMSGLLVSVVPLPGVILAPVAGFLADRYGRRPVVVVCLVIFGAAGFASSMAPTFALLLFARFMQGVGSAGLLNLAIVLVADHWKGRERTTLIGRNAAAAATCLVVVPPLSGFLAEAVSWRWSLSLATFAIPVAIIAALTLPSHSSIEQGSLWRYVTDLKASMQSSVVSATLTSGFVLYAVVFGVFLVILPIHLDQRYGLEAGARGAVLAAPAVGSIVAALCLGKLSAWASRKAILVVSGLLISCMVLGMGVTSTLWILVAAGLVYGLGDGVLIPTLQDMTATSVRAPQRASVIALWISSVRLGQLTGPLAAGLLLGWSSTETVIIVGSIVFLFVTLFWTTASVDLSRLEQD